MDEKALNDLLRRAKVPPPDEPAKERAVNLSVTEFEAAQGDNKKSQGFSLFSRLTGGSTNKTRRTRMTFSQRKLLYGGFATASAALLAVTSAVYVSQQSGQPAPQEMFDEIVASVEGEMSGLTEQPKYSGQTNENAPLLEAEAPTGITKEADEFSLAEAREKFASGKSEARRLSARSQDAIAPSPTSSITGFRSEIAQPANLAEPLGLSRGRRDDADIQPPGYYEDVGRDKFEDFEVNPIKLVSEAPVSTFSIDVDTSSYSFVRKMINSGVLPRKDAVRIEEMINYFDYAYPLPATMERPFEATVAITESPWAPGKQLLHIGIKGYDIEPDNIPRSNLVFLLDVSGSMNAPDKLPLVRQSMKMLLDSLRPEDTVGIVVYAGAAGTVLEPTEVKARGKIVAALERLSAGGSTAGAEGIRQAYALAESSFDKNAVNRVVLATDGDFNVGITNPAELKDFVERKRKTGIFLSILGFGQGNLNDHLMQQLAQNGNGVAAYIDTLNEARKVLVDEATSTLFPIAKDVKIQVEFNPAKVAEYRLIGYETRALRREDFNNDAVDAGDIGAGHTVTAIYEFTTVGSGAASIEELRYGPKTEAASGPDFNDEFGFLKIRYKSPDEDTSNLMTRPIANDIAQMEDAPVWLTRETRFATAVAGFGQILKGGKYTGEFNYDAVIDLANGAKGDDEFGYRAEFIQLVRLAKSASDMQAR